MSYGKFKSIATGLRGNIKIKAGKPSFIQTEETDEQREDYLIWTGNGYETYGTIKRRGWRYTPGDQRLPE